MIGDPNYFENLAKLRKYNTNEIKDLELRRTGRTLRSAFNLITNMLYNPGKRFYFEKKLYELHQLSLSNIEVTTINDHAAFNIKTGKYDKSINNHFISVVRQIVKDNGLQGIKFNNRDRYFVFEEKL